MSLESLVFATPLTLDVCRGSKGLVHCFLRDFLQGLKRGAACVVRKPPWLEPPVKAVLSSILTDGVDDIHEVHIPGDMKQWAFVDVLFRPKLMRLLLL